MSNSGAIGIAYPMARGGGLFLVLIGSGLISAIAFSGNALVNYAVFFVGVGCATVSLFAAGHWSKASPTLLQIAALVFAIAFEIILFVIMARTLPRGTGEHVRWLWTSMIVGIHFLPMALSFGPAMLLLGAACIVNAGLGLLLLDLPFEVFGLLDGCIKLGFGLWLLVPKTRSAS